MKKIIEVRCIICNTKFDRHVKEGEEGGALVDRTKAKKILRGINSLTCSKSCSKIHLFSTARRTKNKEVENDN